MKKNSNVKKAHHPAAIKEELSKRLKKIEGADKGS